MNPVAEDRCRRCGGWRGGLTGRLCPRCLAARWLDPGDGQDETASPPPPGRVLGDFELGEELGRGATGVVYRARQRSLGREVAVKLLRDAALATAADHRRFRIEAANAARLAHPHIVAIHAVGESGGQPFLVMDLIPGPSLAEATRDAPWPARRAAELTARLADAVQHAHARGVLHRDLKPTNILLDAAGAPRIADFGLARALDDEHPPTLAGQVLGTPGYLAPEQARGEAGVGPAADVYGLGAVLFHLLTGRAPFVAAGAAEALALVLEAEPLSPRVLNPAVPPDLAAVCLRCLGKAPRGRYPSAAALAEDLDRFLAGRPTLARPAGPVERLVRWSRREPRLAALLAVCAALLVAAGLGGAWHLREARRQADQARQAAGLLAGLVDGVGPQMSFGRDAGGVRRLLRATAAQFTGDLAGDPVAGTALLLALGKTWLAMGDFPEARDAFARSAALRARHHGPDDPLTHEALEHEAVALAWLGRPEAGLPLLEASSRRQQAAGATPAARAATLHRLGFVFTHAHRWADAETNLQAALALRTALGDPELPETQRLLGHVLLQLNDRAGAESLLVQAREALARKYGELHPDVADVWCDLGRAFSLAARWAEAQAALHEARRIYRSLLGPEHPRTLGVEWQLAGGLAAAGQPAEAEAAYAALVPRFRAVYGAAHLSTCRLRAGLVRLQEYRGDRPAAWSGWLELLADGHEPEAACRSLAGLAAPEVFFPILAATGEQPVVWRMWTNAPPTGWERPDFDDGEWPPAAAPFGVADTRPRTPWTTSRLCLRRQVSLPERPEGQFLLRIRHDDRLRVWWDGELIVAEGRWSCGGHWLYPVPAARTAGAEHLLAVEVVDTVDGGHANVELYHAPDPAAAEHRLAAAVAERAAAAPEDPRWPRALAWLSAGR